MPAVCPATLEAFTTIKALQSACLIWVGNRDVGLLSGLKSLVYSDFPPNTYVLQKGCDHSCCLLTPKDYTTDVYRGMGRTEREQMCCKGGGGYIQSDQTKWPLMLSLLVLNQMTLQQELLTRVHHSVCVRACAQKVPIRWRLVSTSATVPCLQAHGAVQGIILPNSRNNCW